MAGTATYACEPKGACDRCGFVVAHRRLRKEWTGNMVCPPCFDPRPADTRPPRLDAREGAPIRDARPEPKPVYRAESELGGEDL